MAAIHQTPPNIPERRPREQEIINVDDLDDDIQHRPRQRRRVNQPNDRDVIVISDGDDDNEPHAGPSQPRPNQGRRMRSPQLIRQPSVVPPVPTVPRHLRSGHLSMPMHRLPPPHPADIVRPIDRPFTFEASMEPPHRDRPAPPLAPAPPSHHVPAMGLGGALLATRNFPVRNAAGHRHRGPHEPAAAGAGAGPRRNNFWSLGNLGLFGRAHDPAHADDDERHRFDDRMLLELLAGEWDDMAMARHSAERPLFMSAHHPARRVRHFEPEYKSTYTHRGKPEPGFTFDFAPPAADEFECVAPPLSSPSSSSSADPHAGDGASTILVCARCLDPLLTSDAATGAEHARRRIWALRCGHMLDGKCVAELMQPAPPRSEEGAMWVEIGTGSGKGKGRATEPADDDADELLPRASAPEPQPAPTMRSRLRPRHGPDNGAPRMAAAPAPAPLRVAPRAKGKGKGKTKEQAFEWACPVPGCHHEHRSVLVDGTWGPDERRGAIAMYV